MLLEHQDARKLAELIGKKMAKDPEKWRGIAHRLGDRLPCSSPFGLGASLPPPGAAARALNFMHMAVNGVKRYAEGGGGRGGGSAGEQKEPKDRCCQICLGPDEHGCGPDLFVCQNGEFVCGYFTCNPGNGGGNDCFGSFFHCTQSFVCTSFDDTNGDCYYFTCSEPSPYHRCPTQPFV